MAVEIGGVNVGVGVNIAPFIEGLDAVEKEMRDFSAKMARIRLEGIFTRDAERASTRYIKETGKELNSVFRSWSQNISDVRTGMGKFADYAKQQAYDVKKAFAQIAPAMEGWLQYSKPGSDTKGPLISAIEQIKDFRKKATEAFNSEDMKKHNQQIVQQMRAANDVGDTRKVSQLTDQLITLDKVLVGIRQKAVEGLNKNVLPGLTGISKAADNTIAKLKKYLEENLNYNEDVVVKHLERIRNHIEQRGPMVAEEYERLGKRIRKAMILQGAYDYRNKLTQAEDPANVVKKQIEAIRSLNIEEARAQAEMAKGFNVQKNRDTLLQNYQARLAAGFPLSQKRIDLYRQEYEQKIRLHKIDELTRAEWDAQMRVAKDITQVSIKRRTEEQGLRIAIQQSRTAIAAKYHVEENSLRIMKSLQQLQRSGIQLTSQETNELRRLEGQRLKLERAAGQAKPDGFLSKEWFKSRALWFVQLRGFWELYRQMATALSGGIEFERQMAEVKAITQTTGKDFEDLKQKALDVGTATRFSGKEAAEGMTTLGQAGLSAKEILESIGDVALLASATMYGFKDTAELVVSVMRAWGYETDNTKYITDVLATAINKSRLTMEGLKNGMSYIAAIAPQLNISLEDSVALFGALSNKGMSFTIAATSIRAVLAEILNPTQKFINELAKVGVRLDEIDPKTHNIIEILTTLKKAGWDVENSFAAFERRAATGAAALIDSAAGVKNLANNMYEADRAAMMSEAQLDNLADQWKQFQDVSIETADSLFTKVRPALMALIELLKVFSVVSGGILSPVASLLGMIGRGWVGISQVVRGTFTTTKVREDLKELSDEMQNHQTKIDNIVSAYVRLREGYEKFVKTWKEGVKVVDTNVSIATRHLNNALISAHKAGLITRTQLEDYKKLSETADGRKKVEEDIATALDNQSKSAARQLADTEKLRKERANYFAALAQENIGAEIANFERVLANLESRKSAEKGAGGDSATGIERWKLGRSVTALKSVFGSSMANQDIFNVLMQDPKNKAMLEALRSGKTPEEIISIYRKGLKTPPVPTVTPAEMADLDKRSGIDTSVNERDPWETNVQLKERLGTENELYKEQMNILNLKMKEIKLDGVTLDDAVELLKKTEEREKIQKRIVANEAIISATPTKETDLKTKQQLDTIKLREKAGYMEAEQAAQTQAAAIFEAYKKTQTQRLQLEKKRIQDEIDTLGRRAKQLEAGGITEEEEKDLNLLYQERNRLMDDKANIDFSINILADQAYETAKKNLLIAIEENNETKKQAALKVLQSAADTKIKLLNYEYAKKQMKLEEAQIELAERTELTKENSLKITKQALQLELDKLSVEAEVAKVAELTEKEAQLRQQILATQLKMKQATYDLARAQQPIIDGLHRFRTAYGDMNDQVAGLTYNTLTNFGEGISGVASNALMNFPERRQEAASMKGEVEQLNHELKETKKNIQLAIQNEDVNSLIEYGQRAEEIKEQIAAMNAEIARMEDPLENAKQGLKDFFRTFVEELQRAIIKLLVFTVMKKIAGLATSGGWEESSTGLMVHASDTPGLAMAHGGVLPHIESFRRFSSGGLTRNPTLALLGDNKSGRELIIPEENIKSNSVSGYMREKEESTINVINVLTQEDVAMAMANVQGERVILNTIGKDLNKQGPIYRQLRSK